MNNLTPVCLFTYNRFDELILCLNSLKSSPVAANTILYVFSDGPRNSIDEKIINKIRDYIITLDGFSQVIPIFQEQNIGLSESIIKGVSYVISKHGKVIVIEDDLYLSNDFLEYMNDALFYYKYNTDVFNISGFSFNIPIISKQNYDVVYTNRASSWGWGTWKDRWDLIDWELDNYNVEDILKFKKQFNLAGSDMTKMLIEWKEGIINSWSIRYNFNMFLLNKNDISPRKSKVINLGFRSNASNTKNFSIRYYIRKIDNNNNNKDFNFLNKPQNPPLYNLCFKFYNSYFIRLIDKLLRLCLKG